MAKVVVAKLKAEKGKAAAGTSVVEKRVRDASGKLQVVRTIDGHSKSFANDLTYVFARNVAKARRENRAVTGVADRAPAKD